MNSNAELPMMAKYVRRALPCAPRALPCARVIAFSVAALLLCAPMRVHAQDHVTTPDRVTTQRHTRSRAERREEDSLRAALRLPIAASTYAIPSGSIESPTAFGAEFGDVFAGAGFQWRTRYTRTKDGMLAAGAGFGDRARNIGVEITGTSFSTLRQGFGTNGSFSIKVHRLVGRTSAIAVGYENAVRWGVPDGGQSAFAVASTFVPIRADATTPFGGIGLSLGIGNARFRSEADVDNHNANVNTFGSASVRVARPLLLIADWTGQDLAVGATVQPLRRLPFVLTFGLADLTGRAGDGARFVSGGGVAWRVR